METNPSSWYTRHGVLGIFAGRFPLLLNTCQASRGRGGESVSHHTALYIFHIIIIQQHTASYSTTQHHTAPHSTIQHHTA